MAGTFDGVTQELFEQFRDVRMGQANPERMNNPFWEAMIRYGGDSCWAGKHFGSKVDFKDRRPIWCFNRFGQTKTFLPEEEGVLFIAGEHEDGYDPDFAIYNDVVVRRYDGSIEIYGYPRDVFPPTDFHTATLVKDDIYIVGSLGYPEDRTVGTTPVYRLDTVRMGIHRIEVKGPEPGWLHNHEALYWKDEHSIIVWGGSLDIGEEELVTNTQMWALSLDRYDWRPLEAITLTKSASRWLFD